MLSFFPSFLWEQSSSAVCLLEPRQRNPWGILCWLHRGVHWAALRPNVFEWAFFLSGSFILCMERQCESTTERAQVFWTFFLPLLSPTLPSLSPFSFSPQSSTMSHSLSISVLSLSPPHALLYCPLLHFLLKYSLAFDLTHFLHPRRDETEGKPF